MSLQTIDCPYLPGHLAISCGCWEDYLALARFHYIPRRPATCCGVWTIRHHTTRSPISRPVAVAVLSYPAPLGRYRRMMMHNPRASPAEQLVFANAHLRTISRVIVHPQFRGIGLATLLVRRVIQDCPTRFVEAIARMGHVHPFFKRAGMRRIDHHTPDAPAHFLFDRHHCEHCVRQ